MSLRLLWTFLMVQPDRPDRRIRTCYWNNPDGIIPMSKLEYCARYQQDYMCPCESIHQNWLDQDSFYTVFDLFTSTRSYWTRTSMMPWLIHLHQLEANYKIPFLLWLIHLCTFTVIDSPTLNKNTTPGTTQQCSQLIHAGSELATG